MIRGRSDGRDGRCRAPTDRYSGDRRQHRPTYTFRPAEVGSHGTAVMEPSLCQAVDDRPGPSGKDRTRRGCTRRVPSMPRLNQHPECGSAVRPDRGMHDEWVAEEIVAGLAGGLHRPTTNTEGRSRPGTSPPGIPISPAAARAAAAVLGSQHESGGRIVRSDVREGEQRQQSPPSGADIGPIALATRPGALDVVADLIWMEPDRYRPPTPLLSGPPAFADDPVVSVRQRRRRRASEWLTLRTVHSNTWPRPDATVPPRRAVLGQRSPDLIPACRSGVRAERFAYHQVAVADEPAMSTVECERLGDAGRAIFHGHSVRDRARARRAHARPLCSLAVEPRTVGDALRQRGTRRSGSLGGREFASPMTAVPGSCRLRSLVESAAHL